MNVSQVGRRARLFAAVGAFFLCTTAAHADAPTNDLVASPNALAADIAAATGLSISESQVRAELQMHAQELRPLLRSADAGYLQLSVNEGSDGLDYLTANPRQGHAALVQYNSSGNVRVAVRGVEVSESQLEAALIRAQNLLPDEALTKVSFWTEKESGTIFAETPSDEFAIVSSAFDDWETGLHGGISVAVLPGGEAEGAIIRGGTSASSCTWGFYATERSNGRMLTAGHCGNTQYRGTILLPFLRDVNVGNSDGQVHSIPSGHSGENRIVTSNGNFRTITSRTFWSSMDSGDAVCHTGMTTGWSCGTISSVVGSQAVGGGTRVPRATGAYLRAQPGDSGGPVVSGNSAYGLYEGQNGSNPPDSLMIFTTVDYNEASLGVTVATS